MRKIISLLVLTLALLTLTGCEALFFHPDKTLRYHPDICAAEPQNLSFPSEDGTTLHAWLFKPKEQKMKGVIFFLHGNAQNISYHIESVFWLLDEGYAVFAFDYRGYGASKGEPSIKGVINDSLAAFDYMLASGAPSSRIIVLGQSMGGALAINMAAMTKHQDKISAVITDSAFSSWRRIYREKAGDLIITWPFQYPISWFINDDYAPEKYVNKIDASIKLLFVHNKADHVVGIEHSERLYKAVGERADFWTTEYPGHVSAFRYQELRDALLEYLENLQ